MASLCSTRTEVVTSRRIPEISSWPISVTRALRSAYFWAALPEIINVVTK